ncbi:motility associated factor glycosyltransferase family protein [Butyrivibrio sp. AE3006]|uniref:motility associated factor glycosyltransferase family protein n=1 Tax=Butyrivibrio sp. AE3006 TaxID=1280673 RepID=UPI00047E0F12|nr:6-hydroxymethylpterin diphosphokinase MptE-like protein [Butyrivibrio sp. AE3006]
MIHKEEALRNRNFAVFQERYGFKPEKGSKEDILYRMEEASDGEPVLFIRNAMPSGDLRLNSSYSPTYEAMVWARGRDEQSRRTIIILCGFSTGVFLEALVKQMRPDTEIYVYEPNQSLFSFVCSYTDLSDLIENPRIHLFISEKQINTMTDVIHNMVISNKPEIIGIVTPFYAADTRFHSICTQIGDLSIALRNYKMTRGRNALRCRIHAWNHLEKEHVLSDFKMENIADYSAVIVAAGPSLKKNAYLLKRLKGRALILSTDRALDTLKENGVIPDAAISVDAEKSADFLEYAIKENIPVISSYQLNIDAQEKLSEKLVFFDEISYERSLLGRSFSSSPIDMGGNVAGAAYSVLRIMGLKKIILVGQDLAYLEGKHHSDDRGDGMDEINDVEEIPGINGDTVQSTRMWIKYRDFYVRQIKMHPEIEVIDATEGGALIEGSKIMTLSEVVYDIEKSGKAADFERHFKDLPPAIKPETGHRIREIISDWTRQLGEISEISGELYALCEQLSEITRQQGIKSQEAGDKLTRLDELRKKIFQMEMNNLLEEYWVEDMYLIPPKVFYVRTDEEALETFSEAAAYYKVLKEDALSLRQALEE